MEDTDTDRSSKRANLIEQRIFEISINSIETLKHSTAVEIHKSQNEMKKRLRRYRDRQREIVKSKPGNNENSIEEVIMRQMKNKAKARQQTRPKTSVGCSRGSAESEVFSDSDSDVEIDGSFMIDQQKSKVDLRPKTAMDIYNKRRNVTLDTFANAGRLGSAVKQTRYFDEDELKDRGQFYDYLVDKRITEERNKLNMLDDKVSQFCGTETIQTLARKTQAKRKVFGRPQDWTDSNVRTKSAHAARIPSTNLSPPKQKVDKSTVIRPSTSIGTARDKVNIRSFKKPSYIATA